MRALALFLSVFYTTVSMAGPTCRNALRSYENQWRFESAVEIEIPSTPEVMELFDTTDGTIGPVLGDRINPQDLPEALYNTLRSVVDSDAAIRTISWDLLSYQEKAELIMASARLRNQNYEVTRRIPGLRYREFVTLNFDNHTRGAGMLRSRFLGNNYSNGAQRFRSEDIFGNTAIEFMGPGRMTQNLGFELHLRSANTAGENYISARTFQLSLVRSTMNMHEHIVGPMPITEEIIRNTSRDLSNEGSLPGVLQGPADVVAERVQALRAVHYAVVASLIFDVKMIQRGTPMTTILNEVGRFNFGPSQPEHLTKLFNSFLSGQRNPSENPAYSKGGTVGFRSQAYYDQPVWGIEVRYLSPSLDVEAANSENGRDVTSRALNNLQQRMVNREYFMSTDEAYSLFATADRYEGPSRFVERMSYVGDFNRKLSQSGLAADARERIKTMAEQNHFIKMLFFDWSKLSIFNSRLEQIQNAQRIGIQMLRAGAPSTEVMQRFVARSGIAYTLSQLVN